MVVGAGPAGSSAACTVARSDRSVLLIDKAEFPRDKCCGDGLTTMALRLSEELGLDLNYKIISINKFNKTDYIFCNFELKNILI